MNHKIGVLLVLTAALAWSTAGLFTRVVTTDIPTTIFWRSLIGGVCVFGMYLFMQRKKQSSPPSLLREAFQFSVGEIVIGTLSACGMIFFIAAFFHTTIANVSFVYGMMPLATFLLALIILKEKAEFISLSSCVLCFAGVAVILWGAQNFGEKFGIGLSFVMTFFMASLTIAAKYYPTANVIKATYFSGFFAAAIMLPFSSFADTLPLDYFWLSMYGAINLGIGFGVYLLGVQRVTATTAALVGLLEVPIAPIWAWLLFREDPSLNTIIGGTIILFATTYYLAMQYHTGRPSRYRSAGVK